VLKMERQQPHGVFVDLCLCFFTCGTFTFIVSVAFLAVGMYPMLYYQVLYQKAENVGQLSQLHQNMLISGAWVWFWAGMSVVGFIIGSVGMSFTCRHSVSEES
jgi:hypothetical protein